MPEPPDIDRQQVLSHLTLENSPVAVFWVGTDGRFFRVNTGACRLTGYGQEELLDSIAVADIDPNFARERFNELFEGKDPDAAFHFESTCIRKDGTKVPVLVHMNLVEFEGQQYSCTFVQDISDRKAAELELERLKDRLEEENTYLQEEIKVTHSFGEIIGGSEAFKRSLAAVERVAPTDSTVLILGETGTGKELIARAIHDLSTRRDRPLVKVNCAALPRNLIESELFGHERGAFTGALSRKIGRFELADRGTIFLDEIGDLPPDLQVKLLRVLQEGEFERLGATATIAVDVRVIAATNRKLEEQVTAGEFREDLFYRLNVFPVQVPPLRERRDDIPTLVRHFIDKHGARIGREVNSVPQRVMDRLTSYRWPGNVRELENVIERSLVMSVGNKLEVGDWLAAPGSAATGDLPTLEENERRLIVEALEKTFWRVSGERGAARLLEINPQTLFSRMRRLGIKRSNEAD